MASGGTYFSKKEGGAGGIFGSKYFSKTVGGVGAGLGAAPYLGVGFEGGSVAETGEAPITLPLESLTIL